MSLESVARTIDLLYGQPLSVISQCLRGFLIPEVGCDFITVDFSAIEARVLAWLAGDVKTIEIFKTHGKVYEDAASGIYRVPISKVTKDQRQIGKVAVLALGYQGGVRAFQKMAKTYNVKISDAEADKIKVAWRNAHPEIVKYWWTLDDAAMNATLNPGKTFRCTTKYTSIAYKVMGSFLFCKLPSGRAISYPYPKIEPVETPWGETRDALTYMAEDSLTKKWEKQKAYGGLLTENITQAVARDLLADSMLRLEEHGFKIVMHVHDEIVCEVNKKNTELTLELMEKLMSEVPDWAKDLPMAAEGWRGERYRK